MRTKQLSFETVRKNKKQFRILREMLFTSGFANGLKMNKGSKIMSESVFASISASAGSSDWMIRSWTRFLLNPLRFDIKFGRKSRYSPWHGRIYRLNRSFRNFRRVGERA
jgi:hypothetical protein